MIRLSSSFEFDAWAKVNPVRAVSATSGSDVETPLTVELATLPVCVCRRMKVKLNMSSSSLDKRSKKVGTEADEEASGSCLVYHTLARLYGEVVQAIDTCIYSIGVSSPASRFAVYLVAGNAFGDRVRRRRRELLMVTDEIETATQEFVSLERFRKRRFKS